MLFWQYKQNHTEWCHDMSSMSMSSCTLACRLLSLPSCTPLIPLLKTLTSTCTRKAHQECMAGKDLQYRLKLKPPATVVNMKLATEHVQSIQKTVLLKKTTKSVSSTPTHPTGAIKCQVNNVK